MIKKILFCISILLCYFVFAQARLFTEGNILPKKYNETISFEIESNYIILPIEIDGKKYRFLFDTGATNVVNSSVFKDFKEISEVNIHDSNSKKEEMKMVEVPVYKLGNLSFHNFKFMKFDFSKNFIFNCLNLDGIFGSNSLKDSVVKIDYQNKKITITNSIKNILTSIKGEKMKLVGSQKTPYFQLKLSGKDKAKEDVLFDSGYRGFYLQSDRAYKILKNKDIYENVISAPAQLSLGLFGLELLSEKSIFTIPNFQFGKAKFINVTSYFSNNGDSLLGVEILKYGNLILDFLNSKYYFECFNSEINFTKPYPFYRVIFDNDKIKVGMIINEKLRNVMSVGDVITSIDGQKFNTVNCENVLKLAAGTKDLTVIHNNQEIRIDLKDYQ